MLLGEGVGVDAAARVASSAWVVTTLAAESEPRVDLSAEQPDLLADGLDEWGLLTPPTTSLARVARDVEGEDRGVVAVLAYLHAARPV